MRYQPIGDNPRTGEVEATGAVPHRSERTPVAPWAGPGRYTVRLTVEGKSYTQPLTLRLDPRVKTPPAGLRQLAALSREMYDLAAASHAAYLQARARVDSLSGAARAQVESLAPAAPARAPRALARPGQPAPATPPTLESASRAALAAAMAMQDADVAPTAAQVAACTRARAQVNAVLARWRRLEPPPRRPRRRRWRSESGRPGGGGGAGRRASRRSAPPREGRGHQAGGPAGGGCLGGCE